MIDKLHLSEQDKKKVLKTMQIVIDTREKDNKHITKWFDEKDIPYIVQKLDFGDYTFMVPENKKLGIPTDISFRNDCAIERKRNANELAKNFTKDRARMKAEFARAKENMLLLIENSTYEDICRGKYGAGKYDSKYHPKSFISSLHSFSAEFNIPFICIKEDAFTAPFMYWHFYYYLRECMK